MGQDGDARKTYSDTDSETTEPVRPTGGAEDYVARTLPTTATTATTATTNLRVHRNRRTERYDQRRREALARPGRVSGRGSYVAVVVVVAGVAFAAFALIDRRSLLWASATPAVLLVGGVGAFVKTYQVWRAEGTWPIWQGAGWFLFSLMLVSLSIPGHGRAAVTHQIAVTGLASGRQNEVGDQSFKRLVAVFGTTRRIADG
jgi:hypothetical protein